MRRLWVMLLVRSLGGPVRSRMPLLFCLCLALLTGSHAHADCLQTAEIRGCLIDSASGQPVVGGTVCLRALCEPPCLIEPEACGLCAITDSSGCFVITQACTIPTDHSFSSAFCVDIRAARFAPKTQYQFIYWFAPCLGDYPLNISIDYGGIPIQATCPCACHADPNCDGVINVLDVVLAVNDAFRQGGVPALDSNPACAVVTTDVDCDDDTDVFDVVHLVAVGFRNADPAGEFCEPCGE